jgi:hypothetical protein
VHASVSHLHDVIRGQRGRCGCVGASSGAGSVCTMRAVCVSACTVTPCGTTKEGHTGAASQASQTSDQQQDEEACDTIRGQWGVQSLDSCTNTPCSPRESPSAQSERGPKYTKKRTVSIMADGAVVSGVVVGVMVLMVVVAAVGMLLRVRRCLLGGPLHIGHGVVLVV